MSAIIKFGGVTSTLLSRQQLRKGSCLPPINTTRWNYFSSSSSNNEQNNNKSTTSVKFVGHLKNPIVHQLWTARQQAKEKQDQNSHNVQKTPAMSQTEIRYEFSTDEFLKETYRNPWGQMRFGRILEDLDALAGNIAYGHVQDPHLSIVTASVDRIRLRAPPNL
jgi:hypothetical protein